MSQEHIPTQEQANALLELGLMREQISGFIKGQPIVYFLPTESEPGIAIVQLVEKRLRSGIVSVKDPGGGVKTLARFRGRSNRVAALVGAVELELFGVAVINDQLRDMLDRQGFSVHTDCCPEELGDESVEILTKTFPVRGISNG